MEAITCSRKWGYNLDTMIDGTASTSLQGVQADGTASLKAAQADCTESTSLQRTQAADMTDAALLQEILKLEGGTTESIQKDGEFAKLAFGESKYLVYCVYGRMQKNSHTPIHPIWKDCLSNEKRNLPNHFELPSSLFCDGQYYRGN